MSVRVKQRVRILQDDRYADDWKELHLLPTAPRRVIDAAYRAKIAEVNRVLHVTEAFNGEYFHQAPGAGGETRSAMAEAAE